MKYLELAARIAQASYVPVDHKNYLLAAVCVRQDGAIVTSTNIRTHDRMAAAHAEARILRKAGRGAILYVARINRQGQWAMAKPCHSCATLIKNMQVKTCYFTISEGMFGTWKVS